MTVLASVRELDRSWAAAELPADFLRVTVCEDNPAREQPLRRRDHADGVPRPVETFGDAAVEIRDLVRVGGERLDDLLADTGDGDEEPDGARSAVSFLQDRRLDIAERVRAIAGVRQLLELADLANRHGGDWPAWFRLVVRAVDDLLAGLAVIDEALAGCWRELSERPHVQLATATVGRLRVRDPSPPRPGGASAPGGRARSPLRPVPAVTRTGDQ